MLLDEPLSANDAQTVVQVFTAPEGCSLDDEVAWRAANPGLGLLIDAEAIRRDAQEATRLPSAAARFRQYQLNQRVGRDAENRLITAEVFDSCAEPVPVYDGSPAWAALDLSEVKDMTSLSVTWKSIGKWNVITWAWLPAEGLADREQADGAPYVAWRDRGMLRTTPGRTIDPDVIAREVGEILDDFKIKALSFDRWRINILKAALQRAGRQDIERMLVEFQQSYRAFSPAVAATERLFIEGALRHGASPLLTMAFHNLVTVRDETGNRCPDKRQQRARIDPAVATIMALGSATSDTSSAAPKFQVFFVG